MNLHILPTSELAKAAANYIARLSRQSVSERERFIIALSGGSIPKILFPPLVAESSSTGIDWKAWYIFWADERCVPPTDSESNYYLARKYLFDYVNIPQSQIYTSRRSLEPEKMAEDYQEYIAGFFPSSDYRLPVFDLILLGMGEDGHVASLFPGHELLKEKKRWIAPIVNSPKPPPARITLTLPVINNARHVAFFVTGKGKSSILQKIVEDEAVLIITCTNGKAIEWRIVLVYR